VCGALTVWRKTPWLTAAGVALAAVGVAMLAHGAKEALDAAQRAAHIVQGDLGSVPTYAHTLTGAKSETAKIKNPPNQKLTKCYSIFSLFGKETTGFRV
jgi:hypothetical protein